MDKKVSAFVAEVGNPTSDEGGKKTWYAVDGNQCSQVVINSKDGSMTSSTTDKARCGL